MWLSHCAKMRILPLYFYYSEKNSIVRFVMIHDNYRHESLGHCHFCDKTRRKILIETKTWKNHFVFMIVIVIRKIVPIMSWVPCWQESRHQKHSLLKKYVRLNLSITPKLCPVSWKFLSLSVQIWNSPFS